MVIEHSECHLSAGKLTFAALGRRTPEARLALVAASTSYERRAAALAGEHVTITGG